jgi:hypothetical protein
MLACTSRRSQTQNYHPVPKHHHTPRAVHTHNICCTSHPWPTTTVPCVLTSTSAKPILVAIARYGAPDRMYEARASGADPTLRILRAALHSERFCKPISRSCGLMAGWATRTRCLLAAVAAVVLLLPRATGVYDHGPLLPRNGGASIGEGFPTWYRDNYGRVCRPCIMYDPTATAFCLSTYVSSPPRSPCPCTQ